MSALNSIKDVLEREFQRYDLFYDETQSYRFNSIALFSHIRRLKAYRETLVIECCDYFISQHSKVTYFDVTKELNTIHTAINSILGIRDITYDYLLSIKDEDIVGGKER